jgi:hypothetical protein
MNNQIELGKIYDHVLCMYFSILLFLEFNSKNEGFRNYNDENLVARLLGVLGLPENTQGLQPHAGRVYEKAKELLEKFKEENLKKECEVEDLSDFLKHDILDRDRVISQCGKEYGFQVGIFDEIEGICDKYPDTVKILRVLRPEAALFFQEEFSGDKTRRMPRVSRRKRGPKRKGEKEPDEKGVPKSVKRRPEDLSVELHPEILHALQEGLIGSSRTKDNPELINILKAVHDEFLPYVRTFDRDYMYNEVLCQIYPSLTREEINFRFTSGTISQDDLQQALRNYFEKRKS